MKQEITIEQKNELTNKGWENLQLYSVDKGISPLLSIGQMIEFLDEKGYSIQEGEVHKIMEWPKNKELCDALWEFVKEILNNDE